MKIRQGLSLLAFSIAMLVIAMCATVSADGLSADSLIAAGTNDPRSIFINGCLARGRQNSEAPAYTESLCHCSWNVVASKLTTQDLLDMARFARIYGARFTGTSEFARIKDELNRCQGQATYSSIPTPPYPLAEQNCPTQPRSAALPPGTHMLGRVASFLTRQKTFPGIAVTQRNTRAQPAPGYFGYRRVRLVSLTTPYQFTIALVPAWMSVQLGDYVEYTTVHTDPDKRCNLIPNMLDRVIP